MTFLALTPLQTALLALATTGIVVALYFLKVRRRRVLVSSAILWRRVLEEHSAHSLWQRLRTIMSVLLAVAISLLIALSIARPHIDWLTGKPQRIVIILDTSPSMNTRTSNAGTRWQHAVDEARMLIDYGGPSAQFRVAETSGDLAFGFTADHDEARRLIDELSPKNVEPRFPVLDGNESHIYLISDGVAIHDIPAGVETVSVFEPANNVGITAFDVRPIPSNPLEYEAYLEVDNFGDSTTIGVTLSGGDRDRITRTVSVAAGEKYKESFDLSSFHGGAVQASILTKDDALSSDDIAVAHLPTKRKMRTLLVTRGNPHLQALLKFDRNVELLVTDPGTYHELPDVDAYVFDRFAPAATPLKPALIIGTPDVPWLRPRHGIVQKPKITKWSEEHPIMQHVGLHDVSIQHVPKIDPANLTVIASSDDTPLIVASENPKWVMVTFDMHSSDFPGQSGFPIFIHNALAWLNDEQPAMHTANPLFFDVNGSILKDKTAPLRRRSWLRHELWFYMLLAAIVLVSAEWVTYHRRVTL
jgi:Ca-activated chloride channel homolog